MRKENPLWGTPRIYGELLMLGIEVAPINRGEVHDHAAGPALPGLEDIPAQSRCGDRVPRSVRGSYYGMCGDRASAQRGGDKSTNDQS
jgi:hypothetical protein